MDDIFKPQSLSIKALLGNTDALYQIPHYQRPYSWGDDQLSKLWDDLREAQDVEPNYFLGSIITAKPEEASSYLDIVDGQQRLTTLFILMCVCRDLYPDLNDHLPAENFDAVSAFTVKSSIKLDDRLERLRLRTHANHASDFQDLVIRNGNAITHKKPFQKDLKKEQEPKFKFKNTAAFFKEKLVEIGKEQAGAFMNYLFNNVKIIRIDCNTVGFAIKLFQVLNDRGLDLSNSDLIKSLLIGKIQQMYGEDGELRKHYEDQFMADWKRCEDIATDTNETMNDLFVMYEYYKLGKNPEKSLYDELKQVFSKEDPNAVISEFKNFISHYKSGIYDSTDTIIYSLYYIRWSVYWRTLLTTAQHVNYANTEKFVRLLRRYYYLAWIAGYTLSKVKQTSFNLIGYLKEKRDISFIENEINKQLTEELINRAVDALDSDIYFEPWCKPLLFMIEYELQDNPPYFEMGDRSIQTEHILPQSFDSIAEWAHAKGIPYLDEWIHSGANLTLLSGAKNIAARNYAFPEKIKSYDGTGLENPKDGKITSFQQTQLIVNNYNSGKYNKEWSVDALNGRWTWFCTRVEKLLDLDLTNIKNKRIPDAAEHHQLLVADKE
ncbi:DUF262 domain-containing protein [Chitinophaga sp. S165]|uniref:DUF262 domain-containing protein n=1 Tax=Chitinophaga sp. S165 TaxID=2135462 RepID=UPI000D9DDC1F|nr:DUF262 domain-containing protein [Chitinophaga sp. S165]PWV56152.1 uncharacterized protein with ParB-like and HNH nuclease domain [Chitinophaga sp. S165]